MAIKWQGGTWQKGRVGQWPLATGHILILSSWTSDEYVSPPPCMPKAKEKYAGFALPHVFEQICHDCVSLTMVMEEGPNSVMSVLTLIIIRQLNNNNNIWTYIAHVSTN